METKKNILAGRDYKFLCDASSSMLGTDGKPKNRWVRQQEIVNGVASVACTYDPDGISIFIYTNGITAAYDNVKAGDELLKTLFTTHQPGGSTYTGKALAEVLNSWFAEPEATRKPMTIVVATDGEAADPQDLVHCIIDASKRIKNDEELAITFLQVGADKEASAFLKRLDDDLQKEGARFDIVDFKTEEELTSMGVEAILLAAIND